MQKRSRKGKKPDLNELAASITDQATNPEQPQPKPDYGDKNPAAVELGRLGGLKGGKAGASSITAKQRCNAVGKVAEARWGKRRIRQSNFCRKPLVYHPAFVLQTA